MSTIFSVNYLERIVTAGAAQGSSDAGAVGASDACLEELVGLLFRLTGDLRQRFAECAAQFDLSFAQAMALRQLDDPLPMGELAQRLCCDASNVTGIIDRLEERGLVERRVSPGDRRVKHLVLTDSGRALRRRHTDLLTLDLPLLVDLSADERGLLVDLLRRGVGVDRDT